MSRNLKRMMAGLAAACMLACGIVTPAWAVDAPTGASVTMDGTPVPGFDPTAGYDPTPNDSDISSMRSFNASGRVQLANLPAGWRVNTIPTTWGGRAGVRYHVWNGGTHYNWFMAGASGYKHSRYELRNLDYYWPASDQTITGYDWSRDQTLKDAITVEYPGYHLVDGWTGGGEPTADGYEYAWTASDDPTLTVTHRFLTKRPEQTDWTQLKAWLPDGSPVTNFSFTGTNYIPTDTDSVTLTGVPSGWSSSQANRSDRIIVTFTKTDQLAQYLILYKTDDYTYSYDASQLKNVKAMLKGTMTPVDGFTPMQSGSWTLPEGANGVDVTGMPADWTLEPETQGNTIVYHAASPDGSVTVDWTFTLTDPKPAPSDLKGLTPSVDGTPVDGFNPLASGSYTIPAGATVSWTGIPLTGWTWTHTTGTLVWTITSSDGEYSYTYTFTTEATLDDLKTVTALLPDGTPVDNFDPVNGGTFTVPAGTTSVSLENIPDGWTSTPLDDGLGFTVSNEKAGLTVTYRFDVEQAQEFTISFDTKVKDVTVPDQTVTDGGLVTKPADPTRKGWLFTGWYLGDTAYDFTTPVHGSFTLTAGWRLALHTVTFDPGNGSASSSILVDDGKPATRPVDPTRTGWTFNGWLLDGRPYDFTDPVTSDLLLTGSWTIRSYTVSFDTGVDGLTVPDQTIDYGETAVEPAPLTRDGYEFTGWLWAGQPYDFTDPVIGDVTLTAGWKRITHTVSFDTGTDSKLPDQTVDDGDVAVQPRDPARVGYVFTGWLWNGQPYDFNHPVTGDITLEAGWKRITHTVTFNTGLTDITVDPQTVEDGDSAVKPADPVRAGYDFDGWLLDGQSYDFTTPVTGDITLVAVWTATTPDTHTVTFDTGDGATLIPSQTVNDGDPATRPADPVRDGHVFDGWLLDGQPYDFTTPVTSDITLTAAWTPAPAIHTVSFDTGADGSMVPDQTVTDGQPAVKPADPTRDGYVFTGWNLDGRPYDFTTPVTGDITLEAGWEPEQPATHTVTFDTGVTGETIPAQSVNDGDMAFKPADPVRDGWTFTGWLLDGQPYDFKTPVTKDMTLTAGWKRVTHIVSFDTGVAGQSIPDQTVNDGDAASRPADPIRAGWTFTGWQLDGKPYDFTTPVTRDVTLTAGWAKVTPATYTVSFDTGKDGSTIPVQKVTAGDRAAKPADPTRKGYVFTGWLLDGKAYDFTTPVTSDITLTAGWVKAKPATHTVTFDTGADGSGIPSQTVDEGETATRPKDPTRDGYSFTGWQLDGQPYDFTTPVTKDITLTAGWRRVTHTVSFDTGAGVTIIPTQTVNDGDKAAKPTDPKRDGWTFTGWTLDGKPYDFTTPVTKDVTLEAGWKRATHTVSFDTGVKGETIPDQTVEDGAKVMKPRDPTRDGYEFTGWLLDGKAYDFTRPVRSDLTLTAGWEQSKPRTHTVTFDTGVDGLTVSPQTVEDGAKAVKPADPKRDGYEFTGWLLDGKPYDFNTPVTADITLTAGWSKQGQSLDDLKGLTPSVDGTPVDGFDPTKSGSYTVPADATVSWKGIPGDGWTWKHDKGTLVWTITSDDGRYSFTYTFTVETPAPSAMDLKDVTAVLPDGSKVDGFDPVKGGTFTVPEGTESISLKNLPDGWKATPLKTGLGWTLTSGDGKITVTYLFTPMQAKTHTVTFDTGVTGLTVEPQTVDDGEKAVKPTDPKRDGYSFTGWLLDGKPYDFTTPVTEDLTLTAGWEQVKPKAFTVSFDTGVAGLTIPDQIVNDGAKASKPTDPKRDGWTFTGWTLNGKAYDFNTPITGDITLTAGWEQVKPRTFTVSFDTGVTGLTIPSQTVTDGGRANKPTDPKREGYEFTGWTLDGKAYDFTRPVTKDINLTAGWKRSTPTPASHTVSFDTGVKGESISDQTVADGAKASKPKDPTRDGYEFTGWLLDGKPYDFSQPVTKDIRLTASWRQSKPTPAKVTVSFDTGVEGQTVDPQSIEHGVKATKPVDPKRDGYTFTGWLLDGKPYDFDTPVVKDITLTAGWKPTNPATVTHTVTFDTGDHGPKIAPQTVKHGDKAVRPADPTRDGFTFKGWLLGDQPYDFTQPVTGDITLHAAWAQKDPTPGERHENLASTGIDMTGLLGVTGLLALTGIIILRRRNKGKDRE
ncbi:InlB B-repeat-containing protein [Bifidobacterium felsineum]|uniref:InlB B-repeat-containing protein n=1 Tax=Bifidobacterium felsineum TaxID=2045440 RepID=UPI001BDD090A|nr:InlB B-repeat-containing protein [Bifidobacterium felsineum]MBT1164828.1 InlB B-repeat-containing protein [Bifidobacterium felsineum]